jgi:hypothetical protein
MRTHIDPSLARGIRRAYLETVNASNENLKRTLRQNILRQSRLQVDTSKAFHKEIDRCRSLIEQSGLKHQELTLECRKRGLWAALFLNRDLEGGLIGSHGMHATGYARVQTMRITRNPNHMMIKPMNIMISEHAIDRVIQRLGLIDLPIRVSDIQAINTQLSDILIWAAASFFVLGELSQDDSNALTIVLPSEYGFFLGEFNTDQVELRIKTFIDYDKRWPEQLDALRLLRSVELSSLASLAGEIVCRHFFDIQHSALDHSILRCWKEYGWKLKERVERPSAQDAFWERSEMGDISKVLPSRKI